MTQRRIYQNEYPYFVTWRTSEGYPLFEDEKMARLLAEIIFNAGQLKRFDILAYQIMLEHVHLLAYKNQTCFSVNGSAGGDTRARGRENDYPDPTPPRVSAPAGEIISAPAVGRFKKPPTISDLMYSIKSYFLDELRKNHDIPYSIWQPRFYARIVSNRKYLKMIIHYIQNNPVKAGLPEKYHQIPYQFFDWHKINALFKGENDGKIEV